MRFGVLGPLLVEDGPGGARTVAGARQRVLLAALLVRANHVVPAEGLAEIVWDGAPPPGAAALRTQVMRLRRGLGGEVAARVVTRDPGYVITLGEQELDITQFEALYREAGTAVRAGRWRDTVRAVSGALALWRGAPLLDVDSEVLREEHAARLEQLHAQAVEWRVDAEMHLGHHQELTEQLGDLARRYPLRERIHEQRVLALYRCGRQGEALEAYRDARRVLAEELGVEPGAPLRKLHQAILAGNTALAAPPPTPDGDRAVSVAAVTVPRQLPAGIAHFTGRADALRTLNSLASQTGNRPGTVVISAIDGAAGIGKSALALHWGQQAAGSFPDGQLYADLRGFDPAGTPVPAATAIRGFLDAFGVPVAQIPEAPDAQAALYRSLLAGKQVLVVLDNARDAEQVRPLLPGSAGCLAVVTSRNHLSGLIALDGAHPLPLDLLTSAEARELLTRRLGGERAAREPEAVEKLIAACARLPLALNIIAARAAANPGHSLTALAGQLSGARDPLAVLDAGDDKASVRTVISWSYRALGPAAARMFRLLGLHPGPDITAAAAASLAAITPGQARGLLGELARCHLLAEPSLDRYAFHDLLRAYAAGRAREEDGEQGCRVAVHRLLDHYLHTSHAGAHRMQPQRGTLGLASPQRGVRAEPLADHKQALAWFQAEHHVLLGSVTLAAAAGFDACAWQLPWCLATFLDWQGHWHDWAATQRIALAAVTRIGHPMATAEDKVAQAMVRRAFAAVCIRLGDYGDARIHLTECLRSYAQLGDRAGMSRVHRDLGSLAEYQVRYDDALHHAEQAFHLAQSVDDKDGQAFALANISDYLVRLGNYELAQASCRTALGLNQELGSRYGEAHTWLTLGIAELALGRCAEAAACQGQACSLFAELGDRLYEATALGYLGDAHDADGNPCAAGTAWREALAIAGALQHPDAASLRARLAARTP
jgi:DNA-binding SARP family transcriptional activator